MNIENVISRHSPEIAKEAVGWDPNKVLVGSNKKVLWTCRYGHQWTASPNNRVSHQSGCPYCSGRIPVKGENDLATMFPEISSEAHGWNPSSYGPGSNRRSLWACSVCGMEWFTKISHRTVSGSGCPYCAGQRATPGVNDLLTTHPNLASQLVSEDPRNIMYGSGKKLKWRCPECGDEWWAKPNARTSTLRSCSELCPRHSVSGFKNDLDGYLYLMKQPSWNLIQIGITNFPEKRISSHGASGWVLCDLLGPLSGGTVSDLEKYLLKRIRNKKIPSQLSPDNKKWDGYTEGWADSDLSVSSIQELKEILS